MVSLINEMSRWVREPSALLPNINLYQMDIKICPAVTCHVETKLSVTFPSEEKQKKITALNNLKFEFKVCALTYLHQVLVILFELFYS